MICARAASTNMIEAVTAAKTERTRIVPPAKAFGSSRNICRKPAWHEDFLNDLKVPSLFKPNGLRDDPTVVHTAHTYDSSPSLARPFGPTADRWPLPIDGSAIRA